VTSRGEVLGEQVKGGQEFARMGYRLIEKLAMRRLPRQRNAHGRKRAGSDPFCR
jgi:hypothetical protein